MTHTHAHSHHHAALAADDDETGRIDTLDPDLEADEERHELTRSLHAGTPAMREHARHNRFMLPKTGELEQVPLAHTDPKDWGCDAYSVYDLRVQQSVLPDAWSDSVEQASKLPFAKQIVLTGYDSELAGENVVDADGQLERRIPGWVDDVDGEGQGLHSWAAAAFLVAQVEGVCYGFVDNPRAQFRNQISRKAAGARPYLTFLRRSDILRILLERTDAGVLRIGQVAFWQPQTVQDFSDPDAWVHKSVRAIKVVTAGSVQGGEVIPVSTQTWVEEADSETGRTSFVHDPASDYEIRPMNSGDGPDFIDVPLVPLYGRRVGPWRGDSPYLRTAWMAVEVWNLASEARQVASDLAMNTYLFESGVPGEEGGPSKPIDPGSRFAKYRCSTDADARLIWAEQTSDRLVALDARLKEKTRELLQAHRQVDSNRSAQRTATEVRVDSVHSSGDLESRVLLHEAAWTKMLGMMAILGGHKDRGIASIPHDFDIPSEDADRIWTGFLTDRVAAANAFAELRRHGGIGDDFNVDLEIEAEAKRNARLDAPEPAADAVLGALGAVQGPGGTET